MVNRKLKQDLQKASYKRPSDFWGALIAVVSILYGEFIFRVDGYLIANTEPYFQSLPVKVIGFALLLAGLTKLIGILTDNTLARKIGIWSLSGVWFALFVLAVTFSFGSGYPHPSYLFNFLAWASCLIVSFKGDYRE